MLLNNMNIKKITRTVIYSAGIIATITILLFASRSTNVSSAQAIITTCNISSNALDQRGESTFSVQAGQTNSDIYFTAGCGKIIAGIEWVCYYKKITPSPYFTLNDKGDGFGGGNNGAEPFDIVGVASGTGSSTVTVDCTDGNDPDQHPKTTITVNVSPVTSTSTSTTPTSTTSNTGTIIVISENSQTSTVGNLSVPASGWDVLDGATDICDEQGISCSGNAQTYTNQPAGIYNILNATLPSAYTGLSCANAPDCYDATPIYYPVSTQTLLASSTVGFDVLWNPLANMTVSPASLSVTYPGTPSGQVTIGNDGAPGSELSWTANTTTTWLSLSNLSGSLAYNTSKNITLTADGSSLSAGTYQGTVTFTGIPANCTGSDCSITKSVAVALTVTSSTGGPSYYVCTNATTDSCQTTSTNTGYTSCNDACKNGGGGGPSYYVCTNATTDSCQTTSTNTGYTSCTDACGTGGGVSQCNGAANCQAVCNPSLTADPTSIVVPESSSLNYSCSHVTACQLSGGQFNQGQNVAVNQSSETANGNVSTTPSITTTYTLTCVNGNYSDDAVSSNAQVTVNGTGLCEQNPNAAGCPPQ